MSKIYKPTTVKTNIKTGPQKMGRVVPPVKPIIIIKKSTQKKP